MGHYRDKIVGTIFYRSRYATALSNLSRHGDKVAAATFHITHILKKALKRYHREVRNQVRPCQYKLPL